jgi:hypothetical protein
MPRLIKASQHHLSLQCFRLLLGLVDLPLQFFKAIIRSPLRLLRHLKQIEPGLKARFQLRLLPSVLCRRLMILGADGRQRGAGRQSGGED